MFFELQFQLLELENDLLALAAEDHMAVLGEHQPEVFDPFAARAQFVNLFRERVPMRLELCF